MIQVRQQKNGRGRYLQNDSLSSTLVEVWATSGRTAISRMQVVADNKIVDIPTWHAIVLTISARRFIGPFLVVEPAPIRRGEFARLLADAHNDLAVNVFVHRQLS